MDPRVSSNLFTRRNFLSIAAGFAAKLQPATPLLGEVTAERIGKNDTYENADNEGRKRQVLEKTLASVRQNREGLVQSNRQESNK